MTLTSDAHISQIHRPLLIRKFLTGPTEASPGFEGFYPGPCFRLQHKRYIIDILHIIYRHFTYNIYIYVCIYIYMSGGQNYLLPAMDMAKVGGPLLVVKVCTSMLCVEIGYRQVGSPLSVVNVFAQIWTSHVHSPLLWSSAKFVGYSCVYIYKYIHRDAVHFVPPSSHYTSKNLRWKLENWMQTDELQLGYGLFNLGYPATKMCD